MHKRLEMVFMQQNGKSFIISKNNSIASNIKQADTIKYKIDLDYAFVLTAHKSKGSTYNNVFIDVNDMIFIKHIY